MPASYRVVCNLAALLPFQLHSDAMGRQQKSRRWPKLLAAASPVGEPAVACWVYSGLDAALGETTDESFSLSLQVKSISGFAFQTNKSFFKRVYVLDIVHRS